LRKEDINIHFIYNTIYEPEVVYIGLALHPLFLCPFALIPLANLHHFLLEWHHLRCVIRSW
jgi:hypothetical protein